MTMKLIILLLNLNKLQLYFQGSVISRPRPMVIVRKVIVMTFSAHIVYNKNVEGYATRILSG